jgi:hypothetical protein
VTVDKIPFPPVSAYGLPEFESMANMPMAGITFRDTYFVNPSYSSEGVHFHELVHVIQWSTLDVTEFLLTYAVGIAQHEYIHSPLEAIAFELQTQFFVPEIMAPEFPSARAAPASYTTRRRSGLALIAPVPPRRIAR